MFLSRDRAACSGDSLLNDKHKYKYNNKDKYKYNDKAACSGDSLLNDKYKYKYNESAILCQTERLFSMGWDEPSIGCEITCEEGELIHLTQKKKKKKKSYSGEIRRKESYLRSHKTSSAPC